jgi:hypothetical protein
MTQPPGGGFCFASFGNNLGVGGWVRFGLGAQNNDRRVKRKNQGDNTHEQQIQIELESKG